MSTKCFKCWQPWDGWGCVCNDCKRSEQLAEQTRLMVEAAKEQQRQVKLTTFKDPNLITFDDDRIVRPRTPEELEKEKLDNAEAFRIYTETYNNNGVGPIIFVLAIMYLLHLWF